MSRGRRGLCRKTRREHSYLKCVSRFVLQLLLTALKESSYYADSLRTALKFLFSSVLSFVRMCLIYVSCGPSCPHSLLEL